MNNVALKISSLPQLIRGVFERLEEKNTTLATGDRQLSSDEFCELNCLFGDVLERALDLVDREQVKLYVPTSQSRHLLEVLGQNGVAYKFFPNINYCSCKSFKYSVLSTRSQFTCKHVLAAKLAHILGRCKVETIADDNFNFLISGVVYQVTNCDELAGAP